MNVSRRSPAVLQEEASIRRPTNATENLSAPRYHAAVEEQQSKDILYLLLTFRFLNALLVQTFFQPDEYFQSLEPAWQMAFGDDSGAWITWVSVNEQSRMYSASVLTGKRNGNIN